MNEYLRGIVMAAMLALIGGCRSVHAPESSADLWRPAPALPAAGDGDRQRDDDRRMLAQFSGPLRLPQLLEMALLHHPGPQRAWQEARSGEAAMLQFESYFYPSLTVSGRGAWQRSDANAERTEMDVSSYGPAAELKWMLFDFGARRADLQSARHELVAANMRFNKAFLDLVRDVRKNYFDLLLAEEALTAALADLDTASATLEAARQRRESGLGFELDVLQARADYDDAAYKHAGAEGDLRVARGNLASAVGCSADILIDVAPPADGRMPDMAEADLRVLLDQALAQRPDVAEMRAMADAAAAVLRSKRSARLPVFNLGASANRYWNSYSGDLADDDTHEYQAYLSLEWQVFDGFLRRRRQQAAAADLKAARLKLRETELKATAEVWSRYHEYLTAREKMRYSESFLENARGAHELASQGYAAGLKSMLDLLSAQGQLARARENLVQSRRDIWVALAELANALGAMQLAPATGPDAGPVMTQDGGQQ